MTKLVNLSDLFKDMLQDIYYAEKKILKALPKMAKSLDANSRLAEAFIKHHEETKGQIERLEQVFDLIGEKPKAKKCDAIEGITQEADQLMAEIDCKSTLEAGLLAGAQAVEHYKIARYGTLVEWARLLGYDAAAKLLIQTLDQEKQTDGLLNKMAVGAINQNALKAQTERHEQQRVNPHHKAA